MGFSIRFPFGCWIGRLWRYCLMKKCFSNDGVFFGCGPLLVTSLLVTQWGFIPWWSLLQRGDHTQGILDTRESWLKCLAVVWKVTIMFLNLQNHMGGRGGTWRLWFCSGFKTIFTFEGPFTKVDDKIPVLTNTPNTKNRQTVLEFAKLRPFKGKGSSNKPYFFLKSVQGLFIQGWSSPEFDGPGAVNPKTALQATGDGRKVQIKAQVG